MSADPLSLRQCDFTAALARLIVYAGELGLKIKVQELNRTIEAQREYVKTGLSKTMDSRHLDKLAADLAVITPDGVVHTGGEVFRPLGVFWEAIGGRWGGRFGFEDQPKEVQDAKLGWDSDHFEFRKTA